MIGFHHRLDGYEFEQAPGVGDGQVAWHAAVHGFAKSQTQLSNLTELNTFPPNQQQIIAQIYNLLLLFKKALLGKPKGSRREKSTDRTRGL